jgi:hypothetical protein
MDDRYFEPVEKVIQEFENIKGVKMEEINISSLEENIRSGNLFSISFPGRLGRNSFSVMKKNLVRFAHN